MDRADVVIIGGGVTGLSSGYWLAKAGKDVVIVEKGNIGMEASGRAGGLISAGRDNASVIPTIVESLKIWPTLEEELGYPTEFVYKGRLKAAMTEEDMDRVYEMLEDYHNNGLRAEVVDTKEMQDLVPGLSEKALGGLFTLDGGHANPQRTVQAYAWGFQDRGGRLYQNTAVTGITVKNDRIFSVETTAGSIRTDFVVSAAGPQTGLLGEMVGVHIPIAPCRAESIVTVPLEPRFEISLVGNGLYGRQTKKGNLHFGGGPLEWIDVEATTQPPKPSTHMVRNIARRLAELLPGVEDIRVLRGWAGIVESTPDSEPIIDRLDYPEGFIVAVQSGHGFAPSPATGVAVRDLVLQGEASFDISEFRFDRFNGIPRSWRQAMGWQPGAYNT
ncbi:MAG: FAD-dependent oxidoreductase [Dehalococcoidia bacterium]